MSINDRSDSEGGPSRAAKATAAVVTHLEASLAQKRDRLAEARKRLREIEQLLDENNGVSPFAPARFLHPTPVQGVRLAGIEAGVKYADRADLALMVVEGSDATPPSVAGVFTTSKTRAAPVLWCQERVNKTDAGGPIAIAVNSGNANAFTGANGVAGAERMARAAAAATGADLDRVFIASTGVIGEPLPVERIENAMNTAAQALSPTGWEDAARAIMTTDTFAKSASTMVKIAGVQVTISGIAKGSGMIAPDMATMLGFVFTDAAVAPPLLQRLLSEIADATFNSVTVDGDTSTSDSVLLAATGRSGAPRLENGRSEGYAAFRRGLERVMRDLAIQLAKDGEGASKFVTVKVSGAKSRKAARRIGLAIANSPLVKTAWAGEDPNWGRLIMAIGKSGEDADRDALSIRYGPHLVAENGLRAESYDEDTVAAYMKNPQLELFVDVGVGRGDATIWTCDLTHGYVRINADYRS
ncbi:MAG: bifunctional glutamate N-acetyltransferase/amino-acid acetyltransferase ArgJ [Neomegalonema sp.]|nr:bifunctional glutamate N-acetyltransferase/amino-acid acetyltransferase ArgJ [Neomegalonema sp.]